MSLPYGTILYFGVLVLFLIPIIVAGLLGKRLPIYNAFVTLVFLYFYVLSKSSPRSYFYLLCLLATCSCTTLLPLQAGEKAEPRRRIRHSSDSVYSPPYYL